MQGYIQLLENSSKSVGNIVCMGLDPILDAFPSSSSKSICTQITGYFELLFSTMKKEGLVPSAFKPNIGYYTCLDRPFENKFEGTQALVQIITMIRENFKGVPVILDSKRGDIATSSLNYAKEAFDCFFADATTVSPYMGSDSIMPFAYKNKGFYVLDRTSNIGGVDLQNLILNDGGYLFEKVSYKIIEWNKEHNGIGAVVGATNINELKKIVKIFSKNQIPLLIPGVGSQGGSASDVINALNGTSYNLSLVRINSSSGLTHPWKKSPVPENYLSLAVKNIEKLINEAKI